MRRSTLPYTRDLVRLAASARLAIADDQLALGRKEACDAILKGYRHGLSSTGSSFVLEEQHHWLRTIALARLDDPRPFWEKLLLNPPIRKPVPADALRALKVLFPEPHLDYRIVSRCAGVGSLGHRRFLALMDWLGGKLTLEAKALVPSAFHWGERGKAPFTIYYQNLLDGAVRAKDPFVRVIGCWIVGQLSPDSSSVELPSLREKTTGGAPPACHGMGSGQSSPSHPTSDKGHQGGSPTSFRKLAPPGSRSDGRVGASGLENSEKADEKLRPAFELSGASARKFADGGDSASGSTF